MAQTSYFPEGKAFTSYFMFRSFHNGFTLTFCRITYFTPLSCSKTLPFCRKFQHRLEVTLEEVRLRIAEL